MGWWSKLFGKKKDEVILTPEEKAAKEGIEKFGRVLTGDEDECEYCHKPIFRDTEKWTKQAGHYFHRNCWKTGYKNQNIRV